MPWSEIFRFFYILGFANAIFFSLLIFSRKERVQSDKILGVWLIILALQFFWPFVYLSDFEKLVNLAGYEIIAFSLHPIMLYNYINALTQTKINRKNLLISFIPVVVIAISFVPFLIFTDNIKDQYLTKQEGLPTEIIPTFFLIVGCYLFFLIASFIKLKKYKSITLHLYSYKDNVDLLWLRRLLVLYTGLSVLSIPISAILYINDFSLILSDYIFYASLVFFVFFLGYWGYQQGSIFNIDNKSQIIVKPVLSNDDSDFTADAKRLTTIMLRDKPFLDANLSLHQLADMSGFTSHHLSRLINKSFKKNFFEYVNTYRIDAFKKMISEPQFSNFTILGVALECGFNSKSAFNRIFKEHTGITPGQFKKQLS